MAKAGTFVFGQVRPKTSQIFYSSPLGLSRGIVNLKPVVPGHVLVIPKRLVERFHELTPEEVSDIWISAQTIGKALEKHFKVNSLTFVIQDGVDAGQTIKHVHVHVIPRVPGDFTPNDELYRQLEQERPARSEEEMELEAQELSKYWRDENVVNQ